MEVFTFSFTYGDGQRWMSGRISVSEVSAVGERVCPNG